MHQNSSSGSRIEAAVVDERLLAAAGDVDYDGDEPPPVDPPPPPPDYPGGGDGKDLPKPADGED